VTLILVHCDVWAARNWHETKLNYSTLHVLYLLIEVEVNSSPFTPWRHRRNGGIAPFIHNLVCICQLYGPFTLFPAKQTAQCPVQTLWRRKFSSLPGIELKLFDRPALGENTSRNTVAQLQEVMGIKHEKREAGIDSPIMPSFYIRNARNT
jgi:hypothetical protein